MPYLSATGLMILKLSFVFINSEQFKEKRTVSVVYIGGQILYSFLYCSIQIFCCYILHWFQNLVAFVRLGCMPEPKFFIISNKIILN